MRLVAPKRGPLDDHSREYANSKPQPSASCPVCGSRLALESDDGTKTCLCGNELDVRRRKPKPQRAVASIRRVQR